MIDYLKSPFFSPFCGPSVGQGQLSSLIISPSSLSLHTETLYLTSPVKFHTDLHLLSLLPICRKACLFLIPYNSYNISTFQNAGNILPFSYQRCPTVKDVLICIIRHFQQYLVFPLYVPLRCPINICSNSSMLISFAGSHENTSKTVTLSFLPRMLAALMLTHHYSPIPLSAGNRGCLPCPPYGTSPTHCSLNACQAPLCIHQTCISYPPPQSGTLPSSLLCRSPLSYQKRTFSCSGCSAPAYQPTA